LEVELASDGGDQFRSEETQKHADFFRDAYAAQEELAGRKKPEKPSGGRKWSRWWRNPLVWLALVLIVLLLFSTSVAQWPWENSRATVTGQGSPSSGSDPDVEGDPPPPADEESEAEGTGSDGDPYAPLAYHIDVAPEKMAGTEQGFGSFYQIWIDATEEGEMAHFATPGLTGGTLDISFDFAAMTVSGSFDLIYDQVPKGDESVCPGNPQAFSGTATGAFVDLPIVPAPTSETPPADRALSDEDWYPRDEGDWYVGGGFPVDLAMSGIIVMSCATYDGETSYAEWPFDEAATVTAWTDSSISFYRNQGPDHVTRTSINLVVTTVDGGDANPNWRYSFWWSDEPDRQIPDPLEG
jgi:hypothetical protein